jgi:GNAT superfamily N-acetyltransferase
MALFSRKHKCKAANPAACTDPRCPDKKALMNAFESALAEGDYQKMFEAREEMEQFKPFSLTPAKSPEDWDTLVVRSDENQYKAVSIAPKKQTVVYDTNVIPEFGSFSEIQGYFSKDKNILVRLKNLDEQLPDIQCVSLREFYISPALRGQGVGKWILDIITKHADDNGAILFLTPTSSGDNKLAPDHVDYVKRAVQHRSRITDFYGKHGFQQNPFWLPWGGKDELTNEPWNPDLQAQSQFSAKAKDYLSHYTVAQMMRKPTSGWPKAWIKD